MQRSPSRTHPLKPPSIYASLDLSINAICRCMDEHGCIRMVLMHNEPLALYRASRSMQTSHMGESWLVALGFLKFDT